MLDGAHPKRHPRRTRGVAVIPHGTRTGYRYHRCRCARCKAWNAADQRAYQQRRSARETVPRAKAEAARLAARRRWLEAVVGWAEGRTIRLMLCLRCHRVIGCATDTHTCAECELGPDPTGEGLPHRIRRDVTMTIETLPQSSELLPQPAPAPRPRQTRRPAANIAAVGT